MADPLPHVITDIVRQAAGITWSICVRDRSQEVIAEVNAGQPLWTASVGKVLLLLETARRLDEDGGLRTVQLSRQDSEPVAEAGLWQHLDVSSLTVEDVAILISSASDNLAANVLMNHIGLDRVATYATSIGLSQTRLLDRVRAIRRQSDPPNMSCGSASELSHLMAGLAAENAPTPAIARRVTGWLRLNMDLSMVAAAFYLDPLAHRESAGVRLFNKTGSDAGVRADTGAIRWEDDTLSYAAIANWPADQDEQLRPALDGLRRLGEGLAHHLMPPGGRS